MNLTDSIIGFRHAQTIGRVQYAVARKLLDHQESQGAAAIKLIEAAGRMATQSGDQLVAAATGLGAELDAYA